MRTLCEIISTGPEDDEEERLLLKASREEKDEIEAFNCYYNKWTRNGKKRSPC
jgi:hypothetical protein